MAKPSPFQALVDRQLDNDSRRESEVQSADGVLDNQVSQPGSELVRQSGDQSLMGKPRGKSSSPEFQRLTVYLRRETILTLKRRIVGTNIELSDIVQDAVERWVEEAPKR